MTIEERYAFNQMVLDIQKDSKRLEGKIAQKCIEIEKMQKQEKEKTMDLFELKKNDIMMRQDLSTYQCALDESFELGRRSGVMKKTIELRMERIEDGEMKRFDGLIGDLVTIAEKMKKLSQEKYERKKRYRNQ